MDNKPGNYSCAWPTSLFFSDLLKAKVTLYLSLKRPSERERGEGRDRERQSVCVCG